MYMRLSSLCFLGLSIAATMVSSCSSSSNGPGIVEASGGKSSTPSTSTAKGGTSSVFGTTETNPCLGPNPPAECLAKPACGDGKINQESEVCDDGNTKPGDGCTGACKLEPHSKCPVEGQPCESDYQCGNKVVEPGEVCDDGNTTQDDGCSADCTEQSASFSCPVAGEACVRIEFCGSGRVKGDETCDDANTDAGDGCGANCQTEPGWLCQYPGKPCQPVKVCGDGIQSPELQEQCDDGNTKGGDGCAADCKAIESGYQCAAPGQACVDLNRCGDGRVTGAETCDDGNENKGDGCEDCQTTKGYDCPFPGALCIGKCGDGILLVNERCDDGNTKDGDGCSAICTWEKGWACDGEPGKYDCHETTCGDKVVEGSEGCDDQNNDLGDGCTPLCTLEPDCTSGACKSKCGDGLVLASNGEDCDDGNNVSGDGCSSECKVEAGYECKQPPLGGYMVVPAVYRDFKATGDFEMGITGSNAPTTGMVKPTLNAKGKPELSATAPDKMVDSATSFGQWYTDVSGTNKTFASEMRLWRRADGSYVNRYGENGEPWSMTTQIFCGVIGEEVDGAPCTSQYGDTDCQTFGTNVRECVRGTYNGKASWMGVYVTKTFDGNPAFFPVDDSTFTPKAEFASALIPTAYDGNWMDEPGEPSHNFHFTSEVRYWFMYDASKTYKLDFLGDDDVWVFINKKLAVDLGGIHTPINGVIDIGAGGSATVTITQSEGTAAEKAPKTSKIDLGMQDGQVYEIVVFQAERQTQGSSYKLTLSGFNAAASVCGPICGDGVLAPGEQCDDGKNEGGYGKCQPGCVRGPYCGDQKINGPETCDNGVNVDAYGTNGCAPGCVTPARCGDGTSQPEFGETCDDGVNDGSYGGCTATCQYAARCGDGIPQSEFGEACDDGANDGTYNNCAPGCVLGPRCGDGAIQEDFGEQCETDNPDCSANCQIKGVCGDTIVDKDKGEECDDGENDGGYGECGPNCKLGPRCGDGVTQPEEPCDGGENPTGAYGECAANCQLGPHCGDNALQTDNGESCDDGNDTPHDGCTSCQPDSIF